jgi:hypothetical protein
MSAPRRIAEAQVYLMRVRHARYLQLADPKAVPKGLTVSELREGLHLLQDSSQLEETSDAMRGCVNSNPSAGAASTLEQMLNSLAG